MRYFFLISLSLLLYAPIKTQIPYQTVPSWISSDVTNYSTGAALADINHDGWLDLVVSNGNDMARQHVVVYYNNGKGQLSAIPDWQSADLDYNGKLSVGDVNNDGYPDIAVSVYIGLRGFNDKGRVKLYLNNHGTLSTSPGWVSKDSMYTFSCSFGDADGDGDLDLAVACGEGYTGKKESNRIYYNNNGILDSTPGWKSANGGYSYDVAWADMDRDGDLDLLFGNEAGPNQMYLNYSDSIGTSPVWSSSDLSQYANSIFIADVNLDGYPDLAVSDNNQVGGSGKCKIYLNNNGVLNTTPYWSSKFTGYGSGITFADINNDSYPDLITGAWWDSCRIYINQNGTFLETPQWVSATRSVIEEVVCGDLDNKGIDTVVTQYWGDGSERLFYLPVAPVQSLLNVIVQDDTLITGQYCYDLMNGWISFKKPPGDGTAVKFVYFSSHHPDIAVSNWDPTIGNYVFNNIACDLYVESSTEPPSATALYQNFPNPFNPATMFEYQIAREEIISIKIFDILGREVADLFEGARVPGKYRVEWNTAGIAEGIYFYRLKTPSKILTRKMIVLN